jgi:hypothetical protein
MSALRTQTKILATKMTRLATGELTHLHNVRLQLDLNHNHVAKTDLSNTGILIDVNTNAHQLDTVNGISNQRMDHHQQELLTLAM